MAKVMIIYHAKIFTEGRSMALGIRFFEIAKALAKLGHQVLLAEPGYGKDIEIDGMPIIGWSRKNLKSITKDMDVCIVPPLLSKVHFQKMKGTPIIVDICGPGQLEGLSSEISPFSFANYSYHVALSLREGDFFTCGGERQRLYWLGMLTALGRINPMTYNKEMIGVVPQAAPLEKPEPTKNVFRGKIVDEKDKVVLWAGGISPWYDAESVINAMKKVVGEIQNAKLVFVGAKNPMYQLSNKGYWDTLELAQNSGLLNKNIFFTDWLPYKERANMYLESDVAVSMHKNHLEAELSFRTRVVDMLWGGLPVITSGGDEMSEYVEKYEAGRVVEIGNSDMLADATIELLSDDNARARMSRNARRVIEEELCWDKVVKPIDDFCKNPRIAEDKIDKLAKKSYLVVTKPRYTTAIKIRSLLYSARRRYKMGGFKEVAKGVREYMNSKR